MIKPYPDDKDGRREKRSSNVFTTFLTSLPDLERFFQVSARLVPPFSEFTRRTCEGVGGMSAVVAMFFHLFFSGVSSIAEVEG